MASVRFEGTEVGRLAADLHAGSRESAVKAQKTLRKAARELRDDMRSRAPVRTGELRKSISYSSTGPFSIEVGPSKFTAHFVEFGTSRMPPQAFVGPATDVAEPRFVAAVEELGAETLDL